MVVVATGREGEGLRVVMPIPPYLVVELDHEDAVVGDIDEATGDPGVVRVAVPESLDHVYLVAGQVQPALARADLWCCHQ